MSRISKGNSVCFVITTYNNADIIERCIRSVIGQTTKPEGIIVVDDCSKDGTPELVRKRFPQVKVIKKKSQNGPSISRNIGIVAAKEMRADYIAFMDSDVVLSKDWLSKLIGLMDSDNRIGIAGGKLVYGSDISFINSAGGGLYRQGIGFDRGSKESSKKYNRQEALIYLCSAAMLARVSMIDRIGGFDDTFYYGHEDTDIGWRANLAGYRVVYMPTALASHWVSQTMKSQSDRLYFHSVKNRIRMMMKNYSFFSLLWYLPQNVVLTLGGIVLRSGCRLARMKGLIWGLFHLRSTFIERCKVQKLRKVRDSELFKLFSKWDLTFFSK